MIRVDIFHFNIEPVAHLFQRLMDRIAFKLL